MLVKAHFYTYISLSFTHTITFIAVSMSICFITFLFNVALCPNLSRMIIWCAHLVFGFYHKSIFFGCLCAAHAVMSSWARACAHVPTHTLHIKIHEAYLNAYFLIRLVVCHNLDVKNDEYFVDSHTFSCCVWNGWLLFRSFVWCVPLRSRYQRECNRKHTFLHIHTNTSKPNPQQISKKFQFIH